MALAKAQGAQKTHRLAVSVPSHCALLDEPAAKLVEAFKDVTISRPTCGYLSGTTGRVYWQPEKIADDLAMNMARTELADAMVASYEATCAWHRMPPGSVLSGQPDADGKSSVRYASRAGRWLTLSRAVTGKLA